VGKHFPNPSDGDGMGDFRGLIEFAQIGNHKFYISELLVGCSLPSKHDRFA